MFFFNRLVLLLSFFLGCASFSRENWETLDIQENFIIYKKPKQVSKQFKDGDLKFSIQTLLNNFFTYSKLFNQKKYLFDSNLVSSITNVLLNSQPDKYDFLITIKKDDPVFPATRIERTIFFFRLRENLFCWNGKKLKSQ